MSGIRRNLKKRRKDEEKEEGNKKIQRENGKVSRRKGRKMRRIGVYSDKYSAFSLTSCQESTFVLILLACLSGCFSCLADFPSMGTFNAVVVFSFNNDHYYLMLLLLL